MTLVSLCFVAVLGIALAGYLAVCSRSMNTSNRIFQGNLSKQLAEVGIDEALRAFNKNDWANWSSVPSGMTSSAWTLDTTNKRASRTLTFDATRLGQGVTGTVKLRIDNYDANQLRSTWSSSITYRLNDLVGYNGIWYRSLQNSNTNHTPTATGNLAWWVPAPIPWTWSKDLATSTTNDRTLDPTVYASDTAYALYDLVNYNGIWYRCISAVPLATTPTPGTTPSLAQNWSNASVSYTRSDVVYSGSKFYRCIADHISSASYAPPNATYWITTIYWIPVVSSLPWTASGTSYVVGDVVNYSGVQYRCTTAHTSSAAFSTDASNWSSNLPAISLTWATSTFYPRGALVYYSGVWYYCSVAHTSGTFATDLGATPPKWAAFNPSADTWSSASVSYLPGDFVYYSSTWYRCLIQHTSSAGAPPPGTNWTTTGGIPYTSWMYRSSATYSFNNVVYSTVSSTDAWYRCIVTSITGSGNGPGTSNWENALTGSMSAWSNGSINYNLGDAVYYSITSQWYRCILAHTSSTTLTPANTTYWANSPLYSTAWNPGRQYSQYDTVNYNGQWYLVVSSSYTPGTVPVSNPGTWALAPRLLQTWQLGKNYNVNDVVQKSGLWYRCISGSNTNHDPIYGGYWSNPTGGDAYQWNATTAYSVGDYRCSGGAWYKCIAATAANAGQTPNNTTYWTATWANSSGVTTGAPVVCAEGTIAIAGNPSVRTQLRATIAPAPLFPNAAASTTTLTASTSTNLATVDSYDGSVNTVTTGGTYAANVYNNSSNIGYSAVLAAANPGTATNFNINNTSVKGFVAAPSASTTPFAPLWTKSGSAILTDVSGGSGIDLTRVSRSPSIPQFTTLPVSGASSPTSELASAFSSANFSKGTALAMTGNTITNIGTPGGTTPSIYYVTGAALTLTTTAPRILNINGPVILYINDDLYLDGDGTTDGIINITATGSAEIHVAGRLRVAQNSDGIQNLTLDPKRLIIICDTTASTTQFYGDGGFPFYGVIYMPNTTNSVGLNFTNTTSPTSATYAVYGAVSAKKITYDKNMNVHYDTSLRYATFGGVDQPYTVTDWRELSTDEQATMP